jgi:hypothetical protein
MPVDTELQQSPAVETFPLDDAAIASIAELREQLKTAQIAMNAILSYFARQHGLAGTWTLSENGRELVFNGTKTP